MVINKQDEINRKNKIAREAAAKAKRTKKPVVTEDIGTLPKEQALAGGDFDPTPDPSPQALPNSVGILPSGRTFAGLEKEEAAELGGTAAAAKTPEQQAKLRQQAEQRAARRLLEGREGEQAIPEALPEQAIPEEAPQEAPSILDAIIGTPNLGVSPTSAEGTQNIQSLAAIGLQAIPAGKAVKVGKGLSLPLSKGAEASAQGVTKLRALIAGGGTKALASAKKLGGGLFLAGASIVGFSRIITAPERKLASVDSELSQIRESITYPLLGVKNGAMTASEGLDILDDYEASVNEYLKRAKELHIYTDATTLGSDKLGQIEVRAEKILGFIRVAKQDIALAQVSGTPMSDESIAFLINQIERRE